jgi:hypothetical protein
MVLALCGYDDYVVSYYVANYYVASDCHPNVTKSIYCDAAIVDILKRSTKPAITWVI